MTNKLMPDTPAPALSVPTVGGGEWTLAAQQPDTFTMVVFYRGLHCPICKQYLGQLDKLVPDYEKAGFSVIAVSMDDEERATKSRAEWGLSNLTLGYDLSQSTARTWGLYVSSSIKPAENQIFNEPGLFWVRPNGELYLIDVSNMPFARPDLEFMLGKVNMVVENGYPARGALAA